jgi:hypothetical protein
MMMAQRRVSIRFKNSHRGTGTPGNAFIIREKKLFSHQDFKLMFFTLIKFFMVGHRKIQWISEYSSREDYTK